MNICFLDKTYFQYNSKDLYSKNLRGAETVLINLTKALSNLGHKITIINNCPKTEIIDEIKKHVKLRPSGIKGKPKYHSNADGIRHYRNLTYF